MELIITSELLLTFWTDFLIMVSQLCYCFHIIYAAQKHGLDLQLGVSLTENENMQGVEFQSGFSSVFDHGGGGVMKFFHVCLQLELLVCLQSD